MAKPLRRAAALALALWLATGGLGAALADALPSDEPIVYPDLEMDGSLSDAGALEMDESAIGEDEVVTPEPGAALPVQPNIGGSGGKNVLTISTVSNIQFASSFSEGVVDFTNPSGSTVNVVYMLSVSVAELLRQTGRTGYGQEAYAALRAQEGFDPETSCVVLGQTKGIPPGKRVHSIALGALPDGGALPAGRYEAMVAVAAYDIATNERSMVCIEAAVTVDVLSDSVALAAEGGAGRITLYTPLSAKSAVLYTLVTTQGELRRRTGSAHSGGGEEVESGIVPLCELGTAEPGEFLEAEFTIGALPDGTELPAGEYTAWIARSAYDDALGLWTMTNTSTVVELTVRSAK